jgi:hypothetical protein
MAEGRTIPCTRCGIQLEPVAVLISVRGELVCSECAASERAAYETAKVKGTAYYWAFGSLVLGTVPGLFLLTTPQGRLLPFAAWIFFPGVVATTLGVAALHSFVRVEGGGLGGFSAVEHRRALGPLFPWAAASALAGALLGVVAILASSPGFGVLAIVAFMVFRWMQRLKARWE